MALFDKLGEMAKSVTEMANDSFETNRMTGDISLEKGNIECFKRELGEFYWAKFALGEQLEDEAMLVCDKIVAAQDRIRQLEGQIEQIKAEREAEKAERKAARAAEEAAAKAAAAKAAASAVETPMVTEVVDEEAKTTQKFCGSCGAVVAEGQKFCGFCGKAVE